MTLVACGGSSSCTGGGGSDAASSGATGGASAAGGAGRHGATTSVASGGGGAGPCDDGALCDGVTGLCSPLPLCTEAAPCENPVLGGDPLVEPFVTPTCATSVAKYPDFDDGPPRMWTDTNGDERAACVFKPEGTSNEAPRPLLVFLHGASGNAHVIYNGTLLRQKAESYPLSDKVLGFVIASPQGRVLGGYGKFDKGKTAFDNYYRHYGVPADNPDFRSMDKLIDDLVAEGGIDTDRIYMGGWSNGGFFSQAYGMARHDDATPGGNKIAAVISYAAADPFNGITEDDDPACQQQTYPQSGLPIVLMHRACDALVACDAAQQAKFELPPGFDVLGWKNTLGTTVGTDDLYHLMLASTGNKVNACTVPVGCGQVLGLANHLAWPDGVTGGNTDWEPAILDFLRDHPHPDGR